MSFLKIDDDIKRNDIHFPDFIKIDKNITDNKKYATYNLASKKNNK